MIKPYVFYDIFKLLIKGIPRPVGVSIDITNRCNLKCKHCYFLRQNYQAELDDNAWVNKIKDLKNQYKNLLQASWGGGEPLLRKGLIEEGMKFFRYNLIITNGTIPLPNWPNCVFEVSVDGTKKFHEIIRGKNYDKIKQNIDRKDLHINIACIINKLNYQRLRDMVEEWSKTKVKGIHFGFYSPTKTDSIGNLWIDFKLRDKIIEEIRLLKKEYGSFILPTDQVLDLMLSKNYAKVVSNCPFKDFIICLGPDGERKLCPVGGQAICSKCGHSPPFFMEALRSKDLETLKFLFNQIR